MVGDEHLHTIQEIRNDIPDIKIYVMGKRQSDIPSEFLSMDELLLRTLPVPISKACREGTNLRSPVCYIYTSGTTGALVHFPLYMETNTNHSVSKNLILCITCVYF